MDMVQHSLFDGKICPKCGEWKLLIDYHKNRNRPDGLTYYCKSCACSASRLWNDKNTDYRIIRDREYRRLHPRPKSTRKKLSSEDQRLHRTIYARKWRKQNREAYRAINRRVSRRHWHRKRAAVGTYTEAEWQALCAQHHYCCVCCGQRLPLTVDHIVPLSKGGTNFIDNIQPLCRSCNSRKHARTADYRK